MSDSTLGQTGLTGSAFELELPEIQSAVGDTSFKVEPATLDQDYAEIAGLGGASGKGYNPAFDIGLTGVLGAAELGALGIQTADVQDMKTTIEDFERDGATGLTPQEQLAAEQAMMAPIGEMARATLRQQGDMAAAGGGQSAQAIREAREQGNQRLDQATLQAGAKLTELDMQAKREQLQEYKQAIAMKGQRQRAMLDAGVNILGQASGIAGQIRGAQAQKVGIEQGSKAFNWALEQGYTPLEAQQFAATSMELTQGKGRKDKDESLGTLMAESYK